MVRGIDVLTEAVCVLVHVTADSFRHVYEDADGPDVWPTK